jgi:hypothetical protein
MARQAATMPAPQLEKYKFVGCCHGCCYFCRAIRFVQRKSNGGTIFTTPTVQSTPALSSAPAPYFLNSFQGQGDEKNSKNKGAGWVLVEHGGLAVAAAVAFLVVGGSSALGFVCRYSVGAVAGSCVRLVFPARY